MTNRLPPAPPTAGVPILEPCGCRRTEVRGPNGETGVQVEPCLEHAIQQAGVLLQQVGAMLQAGGQNGLNRRMRGQNGAG